MAQCHHLPIGMHEICCVHLKHKIIGDNNEQEH
jgi:hypothetical protein